MRESRAPKYPDVLDIGPPISEGFLRSHLPQNPMGDPVLQVNCSSTCLYPQIQRQTLIMQHRSHCTGNGLVLPLGNPVLLGVVRYSHLSPDAMLCTKVYKLSRGILSPIIRPQDFDPLSPLVLHKSSELLEPCEDLTLGLQEIDPSLPRVVINKCEIVLTTTQGPLSHGPTHVRVY
jgi:hypothetical protein